MNFSEPGFTNVLMTSITQESSARETDEKTITDQEKNVLKRNQIILYVLLRDKSSLQFVSLCSLSITLYYPKGHLQVTRDGFTKQKEEGD